MSGTNPPLYCTLTLLFAMRDTKQNKDKGHDEPGYSSKISIGSRIGWMSALLYYYHIINHQASSYRLARQETRFCFLIIIR